MTRTTGFDPGYMAATTATLYGADAYPAPAPNPYAPYALPPYTEYVCPPAPKPARTPHPAYSLPDSHAGQNGTPAQIPEYLTAGNATPEHQRDDDEYWALVEAVAEEAILNNASLTAEEAVQLGRDAADAEPPSLLEGFGFRTKPDNPRRLQRRSRDMSEASLGRKLLQTVSAATMRPVVKVQLWSQAMRRGFNALSSRQRRAVGLVGALAAAAVFGAIIPLEANQIPVHQLEQVVAEAMMSS